MLVLITTILGIFSSTLPGLLRFFENRQKFKHEIQLEGLRYEASLRNIEAVKELEKIKATVQDTQAARDHDNAENASPWMEAFRSSVRPVITYAFFGLFFGIKLVAFLVLMKAGFTVENVGAAVSIILDETTVSIITIVIGFYFGSRAMNTKDK